jgi:hypothetical protein
MKRVLVVLLALSALTGCSPTSGARPTTPSPVPTPHAGEFTRPAALSGEPCGLEASEDHLWILSCSGTLFQIGKRGPGSRTSHLGGEVLSLDGLVGASADRLWALISTRTKRTRNGKVIAIQLGSGDPGSTVDVGGSVPMSAADGDAGLWVGMLDGRLLVVRDGSAELIATAEPLMWVRTEASTLWTISENGVATLRDPATGVARSTYSGIAPEPIAAAAAFGSLWAATPSTVVRLDPATGTARALDVDATVNGIEACGEQLWLSQADFGVRSLTPDGDVAAALRLDVAPRYLACDGSVLWVLTEDGRIGSIRIAS